MTSLIDEVNRALFFSDVPDGTLKPKDTTRKAATSFAEAIGNLGADLENTLFFSDLASIARSITGEESKVEETKTEGLEGFEVEAPRKLTKKDRRVSFSAEEKTADNEVDLDEDMMDQVNRFLDDVADEIEEVARYTNDEMRKTEMLATAIDNFDDFARYVKSVAGTDKAEFDEMNRALKAAQKNRTRRGFKTLREVHREAEEPIPTVHEDETDKEVACRGMTVAPPSLNRMKKYNEKRALAKRQAELLAAYEAEQSDMSKKSILKKRYEESLKEQKKAYDHLVTPARGGRFRN